MFGNTILFFTSFLGLLCTLFIFEKSKKKEKSTINKYLFIIIAITSIRFLFHAISLSYPKLDIKIWVTFLDVTIIILMPCFYLYFKNIIYEDRFVIGNLFHFIAPFILCCLFLISIIVNQLYTNLIRKLFFFTGIAFYLIYAYVGYVMLKKSIWNRETDIRVIQKQNQIIKNWSIFLYTSFVAILLIRIITSIISNNPGSFNNDYLWITALVWLCIFVKIILNPEILYGYNTLNKTIDASTEKVILNSVWKIEGTVLPINSDKDIKLEDKVKTLLLGYLHQIEELSFHTQAFRNPDLSIDDIGEALKIPTSHLHFIFKYHCNESFTDYKKIVRVHDATKLLEGGYLKFNKIEALSTKVGFSSYNTFSIAFKNITGVTTLEYLKRL